MRINRLGVTPNNEVENGWERNGFQRQSLKEETGGKNNRFICRKYKVARDTQDY